ncbi:MAG: GxxExxY protein, partial [Alkalinema sp. RU_4_3]|nr:GxxExxY protein [Alkalinema sp. RU_4_3]
SHPPDMPPIPHQNLTYRIIGAAMRVHNNTPRGLREKHYQRALTHQLRQDGLTVIQEHHIELHSGETWLGRLYLDHWVNDTIVIEDKALTRPMGDKELAQILAYLAATQAPVGLLINFGRRRLEYKRILATQTMQNWENAIEPYLWKPPSVML